MGSASAGEYEHSLGTDISLEQALRIERVTAVEVAIQTISQTPPNEDLYADFSIPIFEVLAGWDELITPQLREGACLVVFESIRKPEADEPQNAAQLTKSDLMAHAAAIGSPGYLGYYKGNLATNRACRSFCLWESADLMAEGSMNAFHRAAIDTIHLFESFNVKRYILADNGQGQLKFKLVHEGGHKPSADGPRPRRV